MPVRVIATMLAVKGKGAELAKLIGANLPNVQKEPGCEQYTLFIGLENPDQLVMLERWKDHPSLDAHLKIARAKPPLAPHLRSAPSTLEFIDVP